MGNFVSFPAPVNPGDTPLVQHGGFDYVCTGCGGRVPDGAWLHETIEDGMVVGLWARNGPDGPIVHECGRVDR